jgi:hypothetical protein
MGAPIDTSELNGDSVLWKEWLNERQVAKQFAVNNRALRDLALAAGIEGFRAPDKTVRYAPELVQQLQVALAMREEAADEIDPEEKRPGKDAFLAELVKALQQAHGHNERLVTLYTQPAEKLNSTWLGLIDTLTKRVSALELERDEYAAKRRAEDQLSHDRLLETQLITERLARRKELFDMAKTRIPLVFDAIEKTMLGVDPNVKGQVGDAIDLLKSLTVEQLALMLAPELKLLDDKQRGLIRKRLRRPIRRQRQKEVKNKWTFSSLLRGRVSAAKLESASILRRSSPLRVPIRRSPGQRRRPTSPTFSPARKSS